MTPPRDAHDLLRRFIASPEASETEREDGLFWQAALERGRVTEAQIGECLREQEELRRSGRPLPLAHVLVDRGHLGAGDAVEISRSLNLAVRLCAPCGGHGAELAAPNDGHLPCIACGKASAPPPSPSAASRPNARTIDKYRILREVARGGMGLVYEAEDPSLGRRVALKVVREDRAETRVIKRHRREAMIAGRLQHPNIVSIHEIGTVKDETGSAVHFIAMDYIEGRTLAEILEEGRTSREERLRILEEVASAAAYAHSKGVIHRDLKPANVLVNHEGRALLTDFGLARAESSFSRMTMPRSIMGTPQYMAPEQVEGSRGTVDERTDVYALGVMLFEILSGKAPFTAASPTQLFHKILEEIPRPPSGYHPSVPRNLEAICLMAMSKNPACRYPNAQGFLDDLVRARRGEPVSARPPGILEKARRALWSRRGLLAMTAAVAALFGAALVGASAWREREAVREREEERNGALRHLEEGRSQLEIAFVELHRLDADPGGIFARAERARAQIENALQTLPDDPLAHYLLGRSWELSGRMSAAENSWRKAVDLDPNFVLGRHAMGRVLLERSYLLTLAPNQEIRADMAAEAQALAEEAASYLRAGADLGGGIQVEIARAMLAWTLRDPEEALALAERSLRSRGGEYGSEDLHWIAGIASPDPAAGLAHLNEAIKQHPNHALALRSRGPVLAFLSRHEEAIADLSRALRFRPTLVQALNDRAIAHRNLGRVDEAIRDLRGAVALDPSYLPALANLADTLILKADHPGAFAAIEEALRLQPDWPAALYIRGRIRSLLDDPEGALRDLDQCLKLNPRFWMACVLRAELLGKKGAPEDLARAEEDLRTVIQEKPDELSLRCHLGKILALQGESLAKEGSRRSAQAKFQEASRALADTLRRAPPDWPPRAKVIERLRMLERTLRQLGTRE